MLTTAVDAVGALELGSEPDNGAQTDDSGLVLFFSSSFNGIVDGFQVRITVVDMEYLPAVRKEALLDVLSEGTGGITIN